MANGSFGGGTGTINDPYLIEDAYDLNAIRTGTNFYKYFRLKNDIDMRSYNNTLDATGWTPIPELRGGLDGNGYVITNFYINRTASNQGLFAQSYRGYVKNLGMKYVYINVTTGSYTGAIVSQMNTLDCLIENCFVEGTIVAAATGSVIMGGIAGTCTLGTIKNCYTNVKLASNLTTGISVGGIAGTITNGYITNCLSLGTIGTGAGTTATVGPIVGSSTTSTITSCYGLTGTWGVIGGGGTFKTLSELQTASTFTGWSTPDYDFITKVWTFTASDTPRLSYQNRVKYMVLVNGDYKTYNFTTNAWVSKGSTLPSDDEFVRTGINRWELGLIPKLRWKDWMNYGSFQLIDNNDKNRMAKAGTLLTLSQSKQVSDGVIMKGTIDFTTLGTAVNQIKIMY